HDALIARLDPTRVRLTALGFSQGAATVCRWAARTRARVDRVVCWGATIPDDVALGESSFGRAAIRLVRGTRDELATAARVAEQVTRLEESGVPFAYLEF